MTRILFVGDSWLGSSARGLRNALARAPGVLLEEVATDTIRPMHRSAPLRAVNRLLEPLYVRELSQRCLDAAERFRPQSVIVYKGAGLTAETIRALGRWDAETVCVFPDHSPHAFGPRIREAVGAFDLVVSTKSFHPAQWKTTYGYDNRCVYVPHGYDADLHERATLPEVAAYDVGLVATWRPEYEMLVKSLAAIPEMSRLRFRLLGRYWGELAKSLPDHWATGPSTTGIEYVEEVRAHAINIAPVQQQVLVEGRSHPGDVDTTRTYEYAAAFTTFIHVETPILREIYTAEELPSYRNADDLASTIVKLHGDDGLRAHYARAAHQRAVPAYSLNARAQTLLAMLRSGAPT